MFPLPMSGAGATARAALSRRRPTDARCATELPPSGQDDREVWRVGKSPREAGIALLARPIMGLMVLSAESSMWRHGADGAVGGAARPFRRAALGEEGRRRLGDSEGRGRDGRDAGAGGAAGVSGGAWFSGGGRPRPAGPHPAERREICRGLCAGGRSRCRAQSEATQFTLEWPPRSGRMQSFPEIDRAAWFTLTEAREKILPSQAPLLDLLEGRIGLRSRRAPTRVARDQQPEIR